MNIDELRKIYERRVDDGIRLLNKTLPNWREYIVIDKIDIDDPYECVFGQIVHNHPDYSDPAVELSHRLWQLAIDLKCQPYDRRYGFDSNHNDLNMLSCANSGIVYALNLLTELWKEKLTGELE